MVQVLLVRDQNFPPRRTNASTTSSTGSASTSTGSAMGSRMATVEVLPCAADGSKLPVNEISAADNSRPSNNDPASPMKSFAGWKLCGRNPTQQPTIAAEMKVARVKTSLPKSCRVE